ncbi:MAG: polysaccharide deacetylase family protein [Cytophagales bacterium CG18_big_fil_WC_8_21_14_2_50_42_9]|nr:MAG: polysaccharide deacetylase family protein [Cytophagales bacterium CG18_big_fil_WC_8_21_14_2_50_42_9]
MRFFKTPRLVSGLLPGLTWRQPGAGKTIYLTFDDGPIPDVTEFVLEELNQYQAQATFFCVGENLFRNPNIALKVVAAGHRLGNHTYNHLRGWKTPDQTYLQNTAKCQNELEKFYPEASPKLFRPPHGRCTLQQYRQLKVNYKLIMWDVLTYDFDAHLSPEKCLQKSILNTRPGSIVVFHDSLKARRNMQYVLPRYLTHFSGLGFEFKSL